MTEEEKEEELRRTGDKRWSRTGQPVYQKKSTPAYEDIPRNAYQDEDTLADTLYNSIFKKPLTPGEPRKTPHGFPLYSTKTPRYDIQQNKRTNYLNRLNLMSSSPTTHYYDKNGRMVKRTMKPEWEKKGYYFDPSGKMQRRSLFPDLEQKHGETIIAAKQLYEQQKDNKVIANIEKGFLTHGTQFASRPEFNRSYAQLVSRGWNDPAAMRTMMSMGENVDKEKARQKFDAPMDTNSPEWKTVTSAAVSAMQMVESYHPNNPQKQQEAYSYLDGLITGITPRNAASRMSLMNSYISMQGAVAQENRMKGKEQQVRLDKQKALKVEMLEAQTEAARAQRKQSHHTKILNEKDPEKKKPLIAAARKEGVQFSTNEVQDMLSMGEKKKEEPKPPPGTTEKFKVNLALANRYVQMIIEGEERPAPSGEGPPGSKIQYFPNPADPKDEEGQRLLRALCHMTNQDYNDIAAKMQMKNPDIYPIEFALDCVQRLEMQGMGMSGALPGYNTQGW